MLKMYCNLLNYYNNYVMRNKCNLYASVVYKIATTIVYKLAIKQVQLQQRCTVAQAQAYISNYTLNTVIMY